MTAWKLFMLAPLVLALLDIVPRIGLHWRALWSPKMRSWLILMGMSLVSYIPMTLYQYLGTSIVMCLVASRLVVIAPKSNWQRSMAALLLGMALITTGFCGVMWLQSIGVMNGPMPNVEILRSRWSELGWAMAFLLLAWSGYDPFGRHLSHRLGAMYRARLETARAR